MDKGYYLSTFITIGDLQNIEFIKLRHDQGIALWKYNEEIELIRYWELERISGIKQHPKAISSIEEFEELLNELLKMEGICRQDIKEIWGTKNIETDITYRTNFECDIAFHSIAHLMSSLFYTKQRNVNETIIGMCLDAGPDSQFEDNAYEKNYYAGCIMQNNHLQIFPIESPARLWSYASKKFNLREGTLMALTTACGKYDSIDIEKYKKYKFFDESSRKNARCVVEEICKYVTEQLSKNPELYCEDKRFSEDEIYISFVMKIIHDVSKEIVSRNMEMILKKVNLDTASCILALAGGFALNCPTNSYILEKYGFRDVRIPPCTSDTGIALGVGVAGFFSEVMKKQKKFCLPTAYYGERADDLSISLKEYNCFIDDVVEVDSEQIVQDIIDNHFIVWINGCAEIGPRALGNRSLLGDPRYIETKNKLNVIKKRQWWRPVAPVVLDEDGITYFEKYRYSPYMLLNFYVKEKYREVIPAIVHLDGSSRVQSINREDNLNLYQLLMEFKKRTGIGVLCNTSLNDAGEPIINTVGEAIVFALNKGIRDIYVNGKYKIILKESKEGLQRIRKRSYYYTHDISDFKQVQIKKNPYNLTLEELTYYYDNPKKFRNRTLKNEEDVKYIMQETREYLLANPDALKR